MAKSLGYQLTLFPFVYSSIYQKEKGAEGGESRWVPRGGINSSQTTKC